MKICSVSLGIEIQWWHTSVGHGADTGVSVDQIHKVPLFLHSWPRQSSMLVSQRSPSNPGGHSQLQVKVTSKHGQFPRPMARFWHYSRWSLLAREVTATIDGYLWGGSWGMPPEKLKNDAHLLYSHCYCFCCLQGEPHSNKGVDKHLFPPWPM